MWVWLRGSRGDGSDQVEVVKPSAAWWAGGSNSHGGCTQLGLGTKAQWRKAPCAGRYRFLCENDITGTEAYIDVNHHLPVWIQH